MYLSDVCVCVCILKHANLYMHSQCRCLCICLDFVYFHKQGRVLLVKRVFVQIGELLQGIVLVLTDVDRLSLIVWLWYTQSFIAISSNHNMCELLRKEHNDVDDVYD